MEDLMIAVPVVSFRDFLLQRYPHLLDQFLEKSTTEEGSEVGTSNHYFLCPSPQPSVMFKTEQHGRIAQG